jgi:hypothetical protein
MGRHPETLNEPAAERTAIRRKVKLLYDRFNHEQWSACFEMIDPKLRSSARVGPECYMASLSEFKRCYGQVRIWYTRINVHLEERNNQHDDRPFAYVYVVWQDDRNAFHMFRERWVRDTDRWYTRVVGLVAHTEGAPTGA